MDLKIITHDVKGFNSPQERKKAFRAYKRLSADILFIQETNFSNCTHPSYFNKSFRELFFTTNKSKFRGVAIFIKFPTVECQNMYKDPASRFLILKGTRQGKVIILSVVYAPNDAQTSFLNPFFFWINTAFYIWWLVGTLIWWHTLNWIGVVL